MSFIRISVCSAVGTPVQEAISSDSEGLSTDTGARGVFQTGAESSCSKSVFGLVLAGGKAVDQIDQIILIPLI